MRNRNQETIPLGYSKNNNKVPRNEPNKEVKNLYSGKYTTLKKEIKEDTNKCTMLMDWKNYHHQNGHTIQSNLYFQCNPY